MPKAAQHHALARQWQLLRLLPTRPPGITSRELAQKLEREGFSVSKRTVERDLQELESIFGIACNNKGTPYGWHWMKGEYADLPGLSLSDALSLKLVEDLLRPLLPAAVIESLETRFEQAKAKLAELSENPTARWSDKVAYVSPTLPMVPPKVDSVVLETIQQALFDETMVRVDYCNASGETSLDLELHPLAMVQRGQITYLVAKAFHYDEIRLFTLHRISKALQLSLAVSRPDDFTLNEYLAKGAMEFGDVSEIQLEARVSIGLARLLAETPLAASQQLREAGEEYDLLVHLKDSWALRWWILGQGAQIEVIRPDYLRMEIATELQQAYKMYCAESSGEARGQ